MKGPIAQAAKNYAVQFGGIEQTSSESVERDRKPLTNSILVVNIGSLTGSAVTIAPPEEQIYPQLRTNPIITVPRFSEKVVGRSQEIKIAIEALLATRSVEFYGCEGIGKTALLQYLAHHPSIIRTFSDGIVYHRLARYQSVSDLVQVLFKTFYSSPGPFKPTNNHDISHALKEKRALIVLDNVKLSAKEIKNLLDQLPNFTFLLATKEPQLANQGHSIKLEPLPLNDSVSMVARELKQTLSGKEQEKDVSELTITLKGHPLHILQAVAYLQQKNLSLNVLNEQIQSAGSFHNWREQVLNTLSKPQKSILMFVAAFNDVGLSAEQITCLAQLYEVKSLLETLLRLNLLRVEGSRYYLASTLVENLPKNWKLTSFWEKALVYFTNKTQQHEQSPERLLDESDAIVRIIEWAGENGRWSDVLSLGLSIEGLLAFNGQWGMWEFVLEQMLKAARALRDPINKAFVLHQLGTRFLCLNEIGKARNYLTQALHIRRKLLNEPEGVEVTSHNLKFLLLKLFLKPSFPNRSKFKLNLAIALKNESILSTIRWSAVVLVLTLGGITFFTKFSESAPVFLQFSSLSGKRKPVDSVEKVEEIARINTASVPQNEIIDKLDIAQEDSATIEPNIEIQTEEKPTSFESSIPENDQNLSQNQTKEIPIPHQAIHKTKPQKVHNHLSILESLMLESSNAILGTTIKGMVILNSPAPAGGVAVNLMSNNRAIASVPSNVIIQAGQTQATFEVSTGVHSGNYPQNSDIEITASYQATSKTTSLKVNNPPPVLRSIVLAPNNAIWGATVKGKIVLSNPAPAGGVVVNLISSDPTLVSVPSNVSVQAGQKSATFEFSPLKDENNSIESKNIEITAFYEAKSITTSLKVDNPPPALESIVLNSSSAISGATVQGTIILSRPAPAGGVVVNLTSSNPTLASVPSNVTVEAGQKQATFEFSTPETSDDSSNTSILEITASYEADSKTISLKLDSDRQLTP